MVVVKVSVVLFYFVKITFFTVSGRKKLIMSPWSVKCDENIFALYYGLIQMEIMYSFLSFYQWTSRCCRAPLLPSATLAGLRRMHLSQREELCLLVPLELINDNALAQMYYTWCWYVLGSKCLSAYWRTWGCASLALNPSLLGSWTCL